MRVGAALLFIAATAFANNEFSGRRAPGFNLPDSNFKRYDLQDYRGKWLLIDFMITTCPHCKDLSKALEQVKAKFGDRLAILEIVITPPETQETVAKYIADNDITLPIVFDQGQVAASYLDVTPKSPTFHTPHLFVIDPDGMIVRDFGHSEENEALFEGAGLIKSLNTIVPARQ
jgi:peroxiredoxin